jgi:4-hydroxybenzoate polyprenyltransferase
MKNPPIVVDLDGTLLDSDFLVESALSYLKANPLRFFKMLGWLMKGKSHLKTRLAETAQPDIETLPYNVSLLEWLRLQKHSGRKLLLATATHISHAKKIAVHLKIFDDVIATTEALNLSGHNKEKVLIGRYGVGGYEYVGNAKADLPVWKSASKAHIVNPEPGVERKAKRLNKTGEVFKTTPPYFKTLTKALRIHQWLKNLLIFIPLAASHQIVQPEQFGWAVVAFLAFGLVASSVYLLNDLLDLQDDRCHPVKHSRPLASGSLPIKHATILIPLLLLVGFSISIFLMPWKFSLVLAAYYALTFAYSFWLKRIVMVDVVTLAALYTTRIIAGAAALSLSPTFWMLAFSMFIFLSLALVKRYAELYDARQKGDEEKARGRGYYPADLELISALGGASGYVAVLVLALYIQDPTTQVLYAQPKIIWLACPLLLFWVSRTWLVAHRGQMHDDPVVFAAKDRVSQVVGVLFGTIFIAASLI